MKNSIMSLKKIKVDAMYGKKRHFNAADRINKYHEWVSYTSLFLNLFTFSALFFALTDGATNWIKYVPLVLSLIASFLGFIQITSNWSKSIEGHRRIGNRYLAVMKECDRLIGYWKDNILKQDEFKDAIEILSKRIDEINQNAEDFPTNLSDYKLSQKGIGEGEENYTNDELSTDEF